MHLLAYNLIRGVMAEAAEAHGRAPRQVSFKGALQTMKAFQECVGRGVARGAGAAGRGDAQGDRGPSRRGPAGPGRAARQQAPAQEATVSQRAEAERLANA